MVLFKLEIILVLANLSGSMEITALKPRFKDQGSVVGVLEIEVVW